MLAGARCFGPALSRALVHDEGLKPLNEWFRV